ncbi:MAG: right-handed parallel beta-helix repeat-containing protein [Kiritimatiellaeota bacterium]|nr:right-handed parallel beta-helix repeat-containing protein [Kiritimatiellota bacterium]
MKIQQNILAIATLLCGVAGAREPVARINVTVDAPVALPRALEIALKSGVKKIVIAPGVYPLVSTLEFRNLTNLTIEAKGVTILRLVPTVRGLDFVHCHGVALHGLTLQCAVPPFTQGRVEKLDEAGKWLELRVDAGYPTNYFGHKTTGYFFDPVTQQWKAGTYDFGFDRADDLGGGLFRLHGPLGRAPRACAVGDLMAFRGPGSADILVADCSAVEISDVAIRNGSGFCIHEDGGEGGNRYSYAVTYGPKPPGATAEPLISANADAFHSSGVRHGPTLDGCRFEGMCDDGVPIHGSYALVLAATNTELFVTRGRFFRAGDPLRLFDQRGALIGEATVVTNRPERGYQMPLLPKGDLTRVFGESRDFWRITLDHPLPATQFCRVSDPNANGSGYTIRRCIIRNHRARGMLLKADRGLVEDNVIEGSTIAGIIIAPEYWWNESCYSRDVVVRGNIIRRCGEATNGPWDQRPGAVNIAGEGQEKGIAYGHQRIVIEKNTFEDNAGVNLLIHGAQDVSVRGNRFVRPQQHATNHGRDHYDPATLIWLDACDGVRLTDNTAINLGTYGTKLVGVTRTARNITGVAGGVDVIRKLWFEFWR